MQARGSTYRDLVPIYAFNLKCKDDQSFFLLRLLSRYEEVKRQRHVRRFSHVCYENVSYPYAQRVHVTRPTRRHVECLVNAVNRLTGQKVLRAEFQCARQGGYTVNLTVSILNEASPNEGFLPIVIRRPQGSPLTNCHPSAKRDAGSASARQEEGMYPPGPKEARPARSVSEWPTGRQVRVNLPPKGTRDASR